MSFEMSCASCEGRLIVETLGIVVACPHCGTHLSIPDEIPGRPGQSETPVADFDEDDDDDSQEGPPGERPGGKSTWVPDFTADDSPSSFPDFSQLEGSSSTSSESNVLVSESDAPSESDVPSAVEVKNPDPSNVIPAIVTDAPSLEPVSGFPVLDDPAAANQRKDAPQIDADQASHETLIESAPPEPAANTKSESVVKELDAAEEVDSFRGINTGEDVEHAESIPLIATDAPTEQAESLPTIGDPAPEQVESLPSIGDGSPGEVEDLPNLGDAVAESVGSFPAFADAASPEPDENRPVVVDAAPTNQRQQMNGTAATTRPEQKTSETPAPEKKEPADKKKQSVYDSVFGSRRGKLVPNAVFQVWFSYTIIMTFAAIWLIIRQLTSTASNLESLPDVKPLKENVRNYVPERAHMPPGHTLDLKESRRFGNIEVTPIKVTRGNLIIQGLDPEGPVLKLFVKFKNVSRDQTIVPLDEELLFDRKDDETRKIGAVANQFVCRAGEKHREGDIVLVYGRMIGIEYTLNGQNLGTPLKPGEEVTIYIPSETESLKQLQGDLIWRVHFRKGYSPKNYGVTTVFEVKFHSDEIQTDSKIDSATA